ncbi:peptidoglycan DD-metalloendopeptidase family protein [Halomonas sp. SSL-5]|uniref:peptidoglycan DD-metalloendopeptidase family protein n=1 Tax=Halomonas sp. SSL-5 TaxID=3065855 RepID=UPI00273A0A8B|nr:peptidoglycan DD-metalloendopeptidase family protein [Halomonas sp. SSL-5]MDY7115067.1 peptidoglycan DD-metalloendopeptidase family protein [Halomonas sp. SSL-5]
MRKVLMISGLALAMAGCASQQDSPGQVPVRDLSASRTDTGASHYTVERGDTLYGIAWRHDMDYRDLARLNRIGPPYEIQPGQRLALEGGGGEGQPAARQPDDGASAVAVATPLGGTQAEADSGDMEWLLPSGETETVSRADRATSSRGEDAAQSVSDDDSGPGPVYSPESPGADGGLSERDLAERGERDAEGEAEQLAEAREASEQASEATAEAGEAREVAETADREEPAREAPSEEATEADAGTAVAGGSQAADRGSRTYTPVAEVPWQWPAPGDVVGQFGDGGAITAGIDIAGQKGQPVKAAGPGIVVYAGSGVRGYGKLILIKHNDQFLSAYAHNDTLRVSENDVVEAGEVIATMGDSDAEDVRLHFEVRKDGQPQDPLEFLPSR